jgi:hypothetical protein
MGDAERKARKKELEKSMEFHAERHTHHSSEGAKHAHALEDARCRLDELIRNWPELTSKKRGTQQ